MDKSNLIFDPEIDEDEFFFHGAKQTHRDITKRVKKKLNMEFDDVFGNESTNIEVFQTCTKPLVQSVMEGYNCSVFVYGATGAGKTFTMLGNDDNLGKKKHPVKFTCFILMVIFSFRNYIFNNERTI